MVILGVVLLAFLCGAAASILRRGSPRTAVTISSPLRLRMSTFETVTTEAPQSDVPPPLPNLEQRRPLKTALLALAARCKRGEIATAADKAKAVEIIEQLEALNPIASPASSSYMLGRWELIFSTTNLFRSSPFFMAARAVCKVGLMYHLMYIAKT